MICLNFQNLHKFRTEIYDIVVDSKQLHAVESRSWFLSEIGTKLRDWAVGQAGGSCYSQAALSSNDSKTLYLSNVIMHGSGPCIMYR